MHRAARHRPWPRSGPRRRSSPAGSRARRSSTGTAPRSRPGCRAGTSVNLKLELFQHTGSFKARGALAVMLGPGADALARGVTAVSAGNHAIATAWAARELRHPREGGHAGQRPIRRAWPRCRALRRASWSWCPTSPRRSTPPSGSAGEEGRAFVHPFEGPLTARGTATVGLEWLEQVAGPRCGPRAGRRRRPARRHRLRRQAAPPRLPGASASSPLGADSMWRSFAAGSPQRLERVATIADSLGAPYALPYSFGLCRRFADEIVRIEDAAMVDAMRLAFDDAEAGAGAGRRRRHRGPARPVARAARRPARRRAGVRLEHRRGDLRAAVDA